MKKLLLMLLLVTACTSGDNYNINAYTTLPAEEEYIEEWFEKNKVSYPELTEEEKVLSENSKSYFPVLKFEYMDKEVRCEVRTRGMVIRALSNEPHPTTRNIIVDSEYNCDVLFGPNEEDMYIYGNIWYQYEQWWGLISPENWRFEEVDSLKYPSLYGECFNCFHLNNYTHRIPLLGLDK